VQTRCQLGVDAELNSLEPELLETPNLCVEARNIGEVGVRPALPGRQGLAE
jgi:hypothetical protein